MEGVADRTFRKAMAQVGGFDEACAEFLRVPANAHVKSLAKAYDPTETAPYPLAAQLMGGDPALMAEMTIEIAKKKPRRIDLNCGCPSNTVTGRGAGSSLLKDPDHLHSVTQAMVEISEVPITVKLRSGFEDISLFKENLLAAQQGGAHFITLHPRTKVEGYKPPARWDLIAQAKELLTIPVVGNGDILNVADARRMLQETGCDALMIGRGSVINPWIFHQIKADFENQPLTEKPAIGSFIRSFALHLPKEMRPKNQLNKLKQLCGYLFRANTSLEEVRNEMLTGSYSCIAAFLDQITPILERRYS